MGRDRSHGWWLHGSARFQRHSWLVAVAKPLACEFSLVDHVRYVYRTNLEVRVAYVLYIDLDLA